MTFNELPIGAEFIDYDGDYCVKTSSTEAKTPYCARGFVAGFRLDETVWLPRKEVPAPQAISMA